MKDYDGNGEIKCCGNCKHEEKKEKSTNNADRKMRAVLRVQSTRDATHLMLKVVKREKSRTAMAAEPTGGLD